MDSNVVLLDSYFHPVLYVENYVSFTWCEKYLEAGVFEMKLPETKENIEGLDSSSYIFNKDSKTLMIITSYKLSHSKGIGEITVSGETLECVLKRRLIYTRMAFDEGSKATLFTIIERLLLENCINVNNSVLPSSSRQYRTIPNFVDYDLTSNLSAAKYNEIMDPNNRIVVTIEAGENLYDVIAKYCKQYEVGMRVIRRYSSDQNETWDDMQYWVFELYDGYDRRRGNEEGNPAIVYSDEFDNLLSFGYTKDMKPLPSDGFVSDKYQNATVTVMSTQYDGPYGLDRYEIKKDYDIDESRYPSKSGYQTRLRTMLDDDLDAIKYEDQLVADIESDFSYKPGVDYFVGDIVDVYTKNGIASDCRIDALYYGFDKQKGYKVYPKFTLIVR